MQHVPTIHIVKHLVWKAGLHQILSLNKNNDNYIEKNKYRNSKLAFSDKYCDMYIYLFLKNWNFCYTLIEIKKLEPTCGSYCIRYKT